MSVDIRKHRYTEKSIFSDPEYREALLNLENMKSQRYFQNIYVDTLHELFHVWPNVSFLANIQLMIRLSSGRNPDNMHRFNVFYALRKLFYFVISNPKFPEFTLHCWPIPFYVIHILPHLIFQRSRNNVSQQLMILEFIYIVAKYTVDDTRSVIWPFILVNEIWDVFTVFKYRTTEYFSFQLQLWKTIETLQYFILLNQYPDFYILIWLLVIATLQILSFSLYFRYPPLTWTVPILNIAPTRAEKDPFSFLYRYMAIGFVLVIFWLYWTLLSRKL
ncbi:hypothetical protein B9Z55_021447 [Caenorhabditis nigoni]|uniref:Uncharacterized protein n=1 Tax=Caenorhabditis nigoni TaxID=1611254 RepID=A0A2G5TS07_9PELO|nr:hypothetical protein B9Z55_021447 [Caenorhabditis nigoni]